MCTSLFVFRSNGALFQEARALFKGSIFPKFLIVYSFVAKEIKIAVSLPQATRVLSASEHFRIENTLELSERPSLSSMNEFVIV